MHHLAVMQWLFMDVALAFLFPYQNKQRLERKSPQVNGNSSGCPSVVSAHQCHWRYHQCIIRKDVAEEMELTRDPTSCLPLSWPGPTLLLPNNIHLASNHFSYSVPKLKFISSTFFVLRWCLMLQAKESP